MSTKINLSDLSVEDLEKLVNDVEKEVERKKKTQVRDIRQQMEKLASSVGMTPEQVLNFEKRKSAKTVGEPKYRNPNDPQQTWTGRGKRPGWFVDALEKGIKPEKMLIK
ncbi:MAG: H-NS histone family protein [Candidatus Competibacteraceae bacterium]|nr:H-NS histone family protein [Candidatus Competibacteraceae bacterium]MCB1813829.1 H-NS histone family protein [Candidatus Competibacteraceae bacterium]